MDSSMFSISLMIFINIIVTIKGNPVSQVSPIVTIKGITLQDFCFRAEKLSSMGLNETEINSQLISELEQLIKRENPDVNLKAITMTGFINMIFSDLLNFIMSTNRRQAIENNQTNKLSNECPSFCSIIEFPEKVNLTSGKESG
ncbi:uncharacterized protein LOC128390742 [Panonychus citri]|uniref:uncharacterized protein LOC128390742 n=1 Tax=Panonychus citri TaxID=50023 RepID=UPI002306E747|nr:uncharacterized protein LOC128390742 [Panonychus citri]